jgi:hypothetical protein
MDAIKPAVVIAKRSTRRRRPKRVTAAFGIVVGIVTISAPIVLDAFPIFRFPYLSKITEAYAKVDEPAIVALGSSRTAGSFNIALMTTFLRKEMPSRNLVPFNASVTASGLVTEETVLRSLLEVGRQPEIVMVEVAPEMLYPSNRWLQVTRDMTWSNFFDVFGEAIRVKGGARLIENRLLPIYALRFGIRRAVWNWTHESLGRKLEKLDPLEPDVPYFVASDLESPPAIPKMTEEWRRYQIRENQAPLKNFSPTGSGTRALARIVALCDERRIPVLLVEAPACSVYREARAPAKDRYIAFLDDLLKRHPSARYCDFSDEMPDVAFYDQHHVNKFGRHLLCKRLAQHAIPEAFASWEQERIRHGIAVRPVNTPPNR